VAHAGAVPDVWPRNFTIGSVPLARTFSTELRIVSQLTFPFRSCLNRYRTHRMPIYRSDPDRSVQFCATTSPVDGPCDSAAWGSPMWNFGRSGLSTIPIQIGIASQGSCTIGNPPYLYTQINRYVSWIHGQICQLSEEPPEFCNEDE
jgi:secreted trypsin-like serine protease